MIRSAEQQKKDPVPLLMSSLLQREPIVHALALASG